ncbi:hypothetical protein CMU35_08585 [Elizabethkingia anophelis]|nr:hypothetical protein [Elizabethkingia anophelis]
MNTELDILILRLIHNNRIELFDPILLWVSKSTYPVAFIIVVYLGGLVVFKKSENIKTIFFRLICMFSVVIPIVLSLKYVVLRTRPFDLYTDIMNLSGANTPSFPSGHTVIAFTLAFGFFFSHVQRLYNWLILGWAIIVAYSRLALGAHFPSDVLTSIAIALMTALVFKNFTLYEWKLKRSRFTF